MRTEVSMIDLSKLEAVVSAAWVCTDEHAKQDSKEDIVVSRVFVILVIGQTEFDSTWCGLAT